MFTFEVIWVGDDSERGTKEIEYIQYYDSYNNGYNMTCGGEVNISGEKQVFVYDEQGNYLTSFKSLSEAARQLQSSPQNIYQALHHKQGRRSITGPNKEKLQFSYENHAQLEPISKIVHKVNKTLVYNYNTGKLLGEYPSNRQASLEWEIGETTGQRMGRGEQEKTFSKKANDFICFKRV